MQISTKCDLKEYLLSLSVDVPFSELPDIKVLRRSKWVDFEEHLEPAWSSEDFWLDVGIHSTIDSIGGHLRCIPDLQVQGDYVRLTVRRGQMGRKFFTAVRAIKPLVFRKPEVLMCETIEDFLRLYNAHPGKQFEGFVK